MKLIKMLPLLSALFVSGVNAEMREHIETPCTVQAPKKIVAIVDKAASLMNFEKKYEVAAPKKAGIQVNPWNKFIAHGINPQTKNPFIVINPAWFLSIPEKQQNFLLGRCFFMFENGMLPLSMKIIPYLFSLFSILFIILLVWGLGKIRLTNYKRWIRILIAFAVSALFNLVITYKLQTKVLQYFGARYDIKINEMALQKTSDREAAIRALMRFDESIKSEIKNGESFWSPYEKLFENYADKLRK